MSNETAEDILEYYGTEVPGVVGQTVQRNLDPFVKSKVRLQTCDGKQMGTTHIHIFPVESPRNRETHHSLIKVCFDDVDRESRYYVIEDDQIKPVVTKLVNDTNFVVTHQQDDYIDGGGGVELEPPSHNQGSTGRKASSSTFLVTD